MARKKHFESGGSNAQSNPVNNPLNDIQARSREMQSSGNIPTNPTDPKEAAAARMTHIANYYSNKPKSNKDGGKIHLKHCSISTAEKRNSKHKDW
jgi:hypothetical protein